MALPTDARPGAMAAPLASHVLTDPWLLEHITSFQAGLPQAIYDFCGRRLLRTATPKLLAPHVDTLLQTVVAHGTPQLLALFQKIRYQAHGAWKTPGYHDVPRLAILSNRADMLQWAINRKMWLHDRLFLWQLAIQKCPPNDLAVAELLALHVPLEAADCNRIFGYGGVEHVPLSLLQWLHAHMPATVEPRASALVMPAAQRGDLAMLRYVLKEFAGCQIYVDALLAAYEASHFTVLDYLIGVCGELLVESYKGESLLEDIVGDTRPKVKAIVAKYAAANHWYEHLVEARAKLETVKTWHRRGVFATATPISIDALVRRSDLDIIRFIQEKGLATATTEAMDVAAEKASWDIVDYLHKHRSDGCTTRAMDAAIKQGHIARAQFFHENYGVGYSAEAMALAAEAQPLELVRYLHAHMPECTTDAMDVAAANGRLHIVQFLHEHRSEGCTTAAVDSAAERGHLAVVRYLLTHRLEGFTRRAITAALGNGHTQVVGLLYDHSPAFFGVEMLCDLLLRGVFEIYMAVAEKHPEEAAAVVDQAMFEAGKQMELPTIHFVVNVLGRRDLAHRAMDGAALTCAVCWVRAVFLLTGPGSCRLSAVHDAVVAVEDQERTRYDHIPFIVSQCSEPGACEHAMAVAEEHDEDLKCEMEDWDEFVADAKMGVLHPFLRDARTPAWAIRILFDRDHQDVCDKIHPGSCDYSRCPAKCAALPWAIRAIARRDLPMLQVIRDLPPTAVQEKLHSYYQDQSRYEPFSFTGAQVTAARVGDVAILDWLLQNVEMPVDPTLLSEAIYSHQYELAEWLVADYPAACTKLDWTEKGNEPALVALGVDSSLLDWLDAHETVRQAVPFAGVIDFAVRMNDVASLRRLYDWHPELIVPRASLIELAERAECRDAVVFFSEMGCYLNATEHAMATKNKFWWPKNRAESTPFVVYTRSDPLAPAFDDSHTPHELPPLHPLSQYPATRSWATDVVAGIAQEGADDAANRRDPLTWPICGVYRRDLSLLQTLHAIPTSVITGYTESVSEDLRFPLTKSFSFQGTRVAAVRRGDVAILEWLLQHIDLPIEPTLLSEAIFYHEYSIAEWLVAHCPAGCAKVDWSDKRGESELRAMGAPRGLLDWLQEHAAVRTAVPAIGIIDFAARQNDVASLERLYEWYPTQFEPRPSLVQLADLEECSDTINFLLEIGWDPEVFFGDGGDDNHDEPSEDE